MIGAPVTSLHNKLNGLEPATTAGLARFAATESAALVAEQAAPAPADAPPAPTATFPERTLWLHRVQTREEGRALYFRDNALIPDGYSLLCYLLRDVRADRVTRVDVKLIYLLFGMQAWMRAVGIRQPQRPAPCTSPAGRWTLPWKGFRARCWRGSPRGLAPAGWACIRPSSTSTPGR